MELNQFFSGLWQEYTAVTPQAEKLFRLFSSRNDTVKNDHVAFRTYDLAPISLSLLEVHLFDFGYRRDQEYFFKQKKLYAWSYVHEDCNQPLVFMSELLTRELSSNAQEIIKGLVSQVDPYSVESPRIFLKGRAWLAPSWDEYTQLLEESEYAAWMSMMGLRANHFTISVNELSQDHSIQQVVDVVRDAGFQLNKSGGVIKGQPEDLLVQASTMADKKVMTFAGGDQHEISTCYYEFSKRYHRENGELFKGFVTANADKIFESTHINQQDSDRQDAQHQQKTEPQTLAEGLKKERSITKVVILGAGKIGCSIAKLLHHTNDYQVTLVDTEESRLSYLNERFGIQYKILDVTNTTALINLFKTQEYVISACSFKLNAGIAAAALESGVHYFDLTEDIKTTNAVRALAEKCRGKHYFCPQCGLAPGFISILAHDLSQQFESVESIKMRVGALPQYPTNKMKYNLTWSTDGLINEYCNPCESLINGRIEKVLPLEGLEKFSLDGKEYEAFNTSGGLGTLCETLCNKVRNMNYKTVRYLGHQYLMDFLINGLELGLESRRDLLKKILETSVPITRQDVVLVFVAVAGTKRGEYTQISDVRKIYHQKILGEHWSSIQVTTASAVCAMIDLCVEGKFPDKHFIRQEDIALQDFIDNRFGQYYLMPG